MTSAQCDSTVTPEQFRDRILDHACRTVGKAVVTMTADDWLQATAHACRDLMAPAWLASHDAFYRDNDKVVCYLSMEFLIGRSLSGNLVKLGLYDTCRKAYELLGLDWKSTAFCEPEAGLGNGGLGRLAACLLDSLATVGVRAWGYGIRYDYGMFRQRLVGGEQVEEPDDWARHGNPWEFKREKSVFEVQFGGRVIQFTDAEGRIRHEWVDGERVLAVGRDQAIPGFQSEVVNTLRLWRAESPHTFDLGRFNTGDYVDAVRSGIESQNLSRILYPDDSTHSGKELRFKQEYFFVCASMRDILRRFLKLNPDLAALPDKIAIQLNDTHPAIAIPELMRLLVDVHQMDWDRAWDICRRTFAYTNHTVMPEALETWPVEMFARLLPRHYEIVCEINRRFLDEVRRVRPGEFDLYRRVSIIDEEGGRRVRMAHLAFVGSHKVNGVAAVHTDLIRKGLFRDLDTVLPGRIVNVTNGVTPRRWLMLSNRQLTELINQRIGTGWQGDLSGLTALEPFANDTATLDALDAVKAHNKRRLARLVAEAAGIDIDPSSLFDVQVKRIHEYKRQLLNLLHVVTLYNRIRAGATEGMVPRTVILGGKAAPAYHMAKRIIRLAGDIAGVVNSDPGVNGWLRLVYMPNYNVSNAQIIIPGADVSEQISTAGTEASGTSNMKFALNGALTIGTLDGANIEIKDEVGEDNIFIFGLNADQANDMRAGRRQDSWDHYHNDPELRQALDMIAAGWFSPDQQDRHRPIVDALLGHDEFLVLTDYRAYVDCQRRVAALYLDRREWHRRALLNVARMGRFSSDRTVTEYARLIWGVAPGAAAAHRPARAAAE
ncbi:glycogen/starch/alpha-glucan phosphorylase [Magnetospirillum sp. UT-4]|uniref:glycogen/starch/alpha-glucan phosphorylase n=1 Tax=Magnetospirillum sp. UT-4 TaxID=2681467 RepID=UPI00138561A4|nr:glycogen/starch/alpha-glucan phosphorylase [Magnetospirillum sp. UT-4]CAA7620147.1 glycogen phosphorylase [Magnetospirillum sp. UT-4]